jgi:hypothetical protein
MYPNNISFLLKNQVLSIDNNGNVSNCVDLRYKLNIKDNIRRLKTKKLRLRI